MKALRWLALGIALLSAPAFSADQKISDLTAGTPPYDPATLMELSVPNGSGGWNSRKGQLSDVGGSVLSLTADTNIAAGTTVSINSSGHAAQTWGPSPSVANTATLLAAPTLTQPSVSAYGPSVLALSATQFVCFQGASSGGFMAQGPGAVAFSISGNVISVGAPSTASGLRSALSAVGLSSSSFLYTYKDGSGNVQAQVGIISGNAISLGTAVQIAASANVGLLDGSLIALTSTQFVVSYLASGGQATLVAGSISGTTITLGTPISAGLPNGALVGLVNLSATTFIASWSDPGTFDGIVIAGTVSGTTITLGSAVDTGIVIGNALPGINGVALSATSFALVMGAYNPPSTETGVSYAIVGTISTRTITLGAPQIVLPSWWAGQNGYAAFIAVLSPTLFAVHNPTASPTFVAVSGTTITPTIGSGLQTSIEINGYPSPIPLAPFGSRGLFPPIISVGSSNVIFTDSEWNIYEANQSGISEPIAHKGIMSYGFAPIDSSHALAVLVLADTSVVARVLTYNPINSLPVGLAAGSCTSGNPCAVSLSGSVSGFSGLTAGQQYYANGDGTLVTGNTGYSAGVAIDTTHLLAKISP